MRNAKDRPIPSVRTHTPSSYIANDLDAVHAALIDRGAEELAPTPVEVARLRYRGGLCLLYSSGRVVVAGPHPAALLRLFDSWSGLPVNASGLLTRRGGAFFTSTPDLLIAALDRRRELRTWRPQLREGERVRELARFYINGPGPRAYVSVTPDGWVRAAGEEPARAARILCSVLGQTVEEVQK